jgi:hypothetical protein
MKAQTPGYSDKPLAQKLGIAEGTRMHLRHAPDDYLEWIRPLPPGVSFDKRLSEGTDIVHVFSTRKKELGKELAAFRKGLRSNAVLWVSWPKKAARLETDITEDSIRELALPLGFVDVKVCAVSEVWSGLKLVIRKEHR